MASVFKYGQMVLGTRDTGPIIRLVERANFGMWMETYSKETGTMIRQMGMEYMYT